MEAGNSFMVHKSGFTKTRLQKALTQAGFTTVGVLRNRFDLIAIASRQRLEKPALQALYGLHYPAPQG